MCENPRGRDMVQYPLDDVEVFTNTIMPRITFTGSTVGIVELDDGRRIAARKEVIICAGTSGTPQVLRKRSIESQHRRAAWHLFTVLYLGESSLDLRQWNN
ncbi:hypothetical protein F5X97DRAFT_28255 [Nemania serpens]|nr:hypothetical protein F5X97DRAFT_28255 [Nemania serpens]